MKLRNGFVSNSSSSSFIVQKCALSPVQLGQLEDNMTTFNKFMKEEVGDGRREDTGYMYADDYDKWELRHRGSQLILCTSMDNLDMGWLLKKIGVPEEAFEPGDEFEWMDGK